MRSSILSPRFRPGKQFALTWSIPDAFGGMTGALMHRSRAFVRLAHRPVDILTLDDRVDYPEVEQRLRAAGELIEGIRIINIWDWLRDADHVASGDTLRHVHEPIPGDTDSTDHRRGGTILLREVRAPYRGCGSIPRGRLAARHRPS
jgi:poly(glycerol-phosphate) alpha-glucosyltransferase